MKSTITTFLTDSHSGTNKVKNCCLMPVLFLLALISFSLINFNAAAQTLYGMTSYGGSNSAGAIIQYSGGISTVEVSLPANANPNGSLMQASDGNLYGMTNDDGTNFGGTIFEYVAGATSYTVKVNLPSGAFPQGSLMQASDGNLYGMTNGDGTNGAGTIFEYVPGATTYTVKVNLPSGAIPNGSLMQASDGNLYGMTNSDGTNHGGTIFEYVPGAASYTVMVNLPSGAYPFGSLMQASDGNLYGMTYSDGTHHGGTIFEYALGATSYTMKVNLPAGAYPHGSLMQASDGNLYGMTFGDGTNSAGTIFEYALGANSYTVKVSLPTSANPYGSLMQASDGNLYGMTFGDGTNNRGTIFEYAPGAPSYTVETTFNVTNGAEPVFGNLMQLCSTPAAPTGSASQSFCSGATVANLTATGTSIKWYAASSGGTALSTSTALVNGTSYYATQTVGSCESTTRLQVTATVNTISVSSTVTNVTGCFYSHNGAISITPSGGTPGYTYSWSGVVNNGYSVNGIYVSTNQNLASLDSGVYTLTITDANSCTATLMATITSPSALRVEFQITKPSCYNSGDGNITMVHTGGITPLNYSDNNGQTFQSSPNFFANLNAGTYTIIVTDSHGCTSTDTSPDTVISFGPTPVTINVTVTTNTMTVTAGGGTAPYKFKQNSGTPTSEANPYIYTGSTTPYSVDCSHNYFYILEDHNGCQSATVGPYHLSNVAGITGATTGCGSVSLTASGGTTYAWSGGSSTNTAANSFTSSGTYTVSVSSATGCNGTASTVVTVNSTGTWLGTTNTDWNDANNWCGGIPTSSTNVDIPSAPSNQPVIGAAGGVCNNITIESGATLTITGSDALAVSGNWTNNGTFTANSSTVTFNGSTTISGTNTSSFHSITDFGTLNAPSSANVNVSGNWINFGTFNANSGTITFNGSSTQEINEPTTFYNLNITGIHVFTNNNGTTVSNNLSISSGAVFDLSVYTSSANSLTLNASGAANGSWGSTASSATNTNNTYFFAHTGLLNVAANTCTAPTAGINNIAGTTVLTCATTSINVTATGGDSYIWSGGATTNTAANSLTASGTYTVTVTTASTGCTATTSIAITSNTTAPTVSISNNNGLTLNCTITSTTLDAGSHSNYLWTDASTNETLVVTTGGTFTVTVTDASNGCTASASATTTFTSTPLTISCPGNISVNNDNGQCGAVVSFAATSTSIPAPTITYTQNPNTSFPIGTTTVTATATNTCGTATCSFTVTVTDNQVPTLSSPGNQTLSTISNTCAANYTIASPITDNCPSSTTWGYSMTGVTLGSASGIAEGSGSGAISFNKGVTTVTLSGTDGTNSATTISFTVTVNDIQPPSITCAAPVTINMTNGQCTGTTTLTQPTASDNCASPTNGLSLDGVNDYFSTPNIKSYFTAATNITIELWFNANAAGIIVDELGGPPPSNGWHDTHIEIESNGNVYVRVWSSQSVLVGNVSFGTWHHVALRYNQNTSTLDGFLDGVQSSGSSTGANQSSGQFYLIMGLTDGQNLGTSAYFNGKIDEVRIWNVARTAGQIQQNMNSEIISPQTGLVVYYQLDQGTAGGTNTGINYATDISGNNLTGTLTNFALTGSTSNWVIGAPLGLSVTNNAPSTYSIGNTTVLWTATDGSGNTATCNQVVSVVDNQAPTLTSPGNQTLNTISNTCAANYTITSPINDNCPSSTTWGYSTIGVTTLSASGIAEGTGSGSLTFNKGITTVTLNGTDGTNSAATISFTITVSDNQPPTISCGGNYTANDATGVCNASIITTNPTTGDNCSTISKLTWAKTGATTGASASTGINNLGTATFNTGITTVTYTVTDGSNNTSTCSYTATVTDNQAPTFYGNSNLDTAPTLAATNVTEASNYQVVYEWDIPNATSSGTSSFAYQVNHSGVSGVSFNRIAYFLQLDSKWAWVSFDKFNSNVTLTQIGIPSATQNPVQFQQIVNNMNVFTSAGAGVTTGTGLSGNVELWDNCYGTTDGLAGIGGNSGSYDFNDQISGGACYGSFQIHNYGALQTILAYNDFAGGGCDLGIGNDPSGGNPDWTFAANGASYSVKKLYILVSAAPGNITLNADAGNCSRANVTYTATATDNCGTPTVTYSPLSGSTFNVGTTTVTATANDGNGNTATVNFTVTIVDNQAPTITCGGNYTANDGAGQCNASVITTNPTTGDNCSVTKLTWATTGATTGSSATTGINNVGTATFNTGVTTVTYIVADAANNTSTCSYTVSVTDNIAPTITCGGNYTANDASGQCNASVVTTNPTTGDNCSVTKLTWAKTGVTTEISASSGINNIGTATFNTGVTTVTYTVADAANNTASCSYTVTVSDNQAPTITSPGNQTLNTISNTCAANYTIGSPINDNCPSSTTWGYSFSGATTGSASGIAEGTGSGVISFNKGITTVTLSGTDGTNSAATTSFTVTVNDNQVPTISCGNNYAANDASGQCNASVITNSPTTGDNCAVTQLTWVKTGATTDVSASSGINTLGTATFNTGITTVTYIVADAANNTATCSYTITITDNQVPTFTSPGNQTLSTISNTCAANYTIASPINDNCPSSTTWGYSLSGVTTGSASGIAEGTNSSSISFNHGITTVTLSGTDGTNNAATTSFTVTVNDNQAPTISSCAAPQSAFANTNCQAAVPDFTGGVTATDNCTATNALVFTQSPTAGTLVTTGITTVTVTVTDGSSNTSTCSTTFTVTDNIPPSVSGCPSDISVYSNSGNPANCSQTATWTPPTATDNCSSVNNISVSHNHSPGDVFNEGQTTVTYTFTDQASNSSTCTFHVTVIDNTPPVISACPSDISVYSNGGNPSNCSQAATWTAPTALDNCSSVNNISLANNHNPGDVFNNGTTTVTYTFTDQASNASTCTFHVIVIDNTAPTITCPNSITLTANHAGCTGSVSLGNPTTNDNCGVQGTANNAPSYFSLGTTTVVWTVTDIHSNTANCTQTVTVNNTLVASSSAGTVACNSGTTTITVSASGGTTAYSGTGTNTVGQGSYTYTVTDAVGCTSATSQTITQPNNLTFTTVVTNNSSCTTAHTATIAVTATGGTGVKTYSDNGGTTYQGATLFSALANGTYTVKVKDGNNCTSAASNIVITISAGITFTTTIVNATTCSAPNGKITVLAIGGDGFFNYSKDGGTTFQSSNIFNSLMNGTYSIKVKDAVSCTSNVATSTVGPNCQTRLEDNSVSMNSNTFEVYPNPASTEVTIVFSSSKEEGYTIRLMDVTGRIVINQDETSVIGDNQFQLNLSELAKGIYMVILQNSDGTLQKKIVVQ